MNFRYRHGDRPLDGYTIQRGVGRGGFGEVYYAVSDGGREVALKSILQNAEIELRGVRHCINLKSPHLVAIFDVRSGQDSVPFVIMEYVSGPSLRDIIREHPEGLGSQKAGYLAREIAKGLAYLHERGIVHRDLKPENIFYEDGYVKIGDYGLSKYISVSHQSGQTMSVGTVHYMAPEIGSGNYSRGIDIYALGVILYELLTGRLPFTGDSFGEILMKHLTAKPDLADIDEPFRAALARALEKKPEDRHQTVEDLVAALFANDALNTSVSIFNPVSLSVAARKSPTAAEDPTGVSPVAKTSPVGMPPPANGGPPAPERAPAAPARSAEARPAAEAAQGTQLATPPPLLRAASEPPTLPPLVAETPPPREPPRAMARLLEPEELDPLDRSQRLARAFFAGGLMTAGMTVVSGHFATLIGFLLTVGAGSTAILVTEEYLAWRFQIKDGFPRRLVAAVLAAVPVAVGLWIANLGHFRGSEVGPLAFLIGLVLVHWDARVDPKRAERISIGQAFWAGLCGLILTAILNSDMNFAAVTVGGALAAMSLVVNAYSPQVPPRLRRHVKSRDKMATPPPKRKTTAKAARREVATRQPPADDGIPYLEAASGFGVGRYRSDHESVPPGPLAKGFWLLVAALLSAAALSCLVVSLIFVIDNPGGRAGEDSLAALGFGLGFLGYVPFGFYRALWARRPSFWRRTLRPFLLSSAGNTMLVSAGMAAWGSIFVSWFSEEGVLGCTIVFICGLLAAGLILGLERLVKFAGSARPPDPLSPRATWPVHPVARLLQALLGFAGMITAFILAASGLYWLNRGGHNTDEGLAFMCFAIGTFYLALFFGRQALRRRRGTLWQGTIRPFILFAAAGTLTIAAVGLASWLMEAFGRGAEEVAVAFSVPGVIALVFGLFAFFIKGNSAAANDSDRSPVEARERREHVEHLVRHGHHEVTRPGAVRPGWAAMGTLLWALGIPLALADATLALNGLGHNWVGGDYEYFQILSRCLWIPLLSVGILSILVSRWGSGVLHLARALVGQGALVGAWIALIVALSFVNVTSDLVVHASSPYYYNFVGNMVVCFVLVTLGILLLAWPQRRWNGAGQSVEPLEEP